LITCNQIDQIVKPLSLAFDRIKPTNMNKQRRGTTAWPHRTDATRETSFSQSVMSGANILTSLVRLKNARDSSFDRSRQAHKNPVE
jgi:RNA polymerase-interacting CarD/CdnL/TRCF family regulator